MSDVNKLDNVFEDNMLVIDITLGIAELFSPYDGTLNATYWGYFGESEALKYTSAVITGALTVVKNTTNTNIEKIAALYWSKVTGGLPIPTLLWSVRSYQDDDKSYDKVTQLFEKNLHINVDGIAYNLGKNSSSSIQAGEKNRVFYSTYTNAEAHRFSTILKQTGKTKRLYINWE